MYTDALRVMLYIPLRSDKTNSRVIRIKNGWVDFISHYVQIKRSLTQGLAGRTELYIPLRSDKTDIVEDTFIRQDFFISHYVQIKRRARNGHCSRKSSFISHYVQIKLAVDRPFTKKDGETLYPTTFR